MQGDNPQIKVIVPFSLKTKNGRKAQKTQNRLKDSHCLSAAATAPLFTWDAVGIIVAFCISYFIFFFNKGKGMWTWSEDRLVTYAKFIVACCVVRGCQRLGNQPWLTGNPLRSPSTVAHIPHPDTHQHSSISGGITGAAARYALQENKRGIQMSS